MLKQSEYDQQAEKWLESTGTKIEKRYTGHRTFFYDDSDKRACWSVTLWRGDNCLNLNFGNSIRDSYKNGNRVERRPSNYSILASLDTYCPSTVYEFCREYGYEANEKTEELYWNIRRIHDKLREMYSDSELESLAEIV